MATRFMKFAEGEFYHIYNRGTDKRVIFKDAADYVRFQQLLYLANSTSSINVRDIKNHHECVYDFQRDNPLVHIGAYCLMPNHFHLLLTPASENGVKMFMQRLATSYSMYFNKRYERRGGLYEGPFKAQYVDDDRYLKYLFAYIHLNPVKLIDSDWKERGIENPAEAYEYVSDYHYSSLIDYIHKNREEQCILDISVFPEYFAESEDVKKEIFEWLTYQETDEVLMHKKS